MKLQIVIIGAWLLISGAAYIAFGESALVRAAYPLSSLASVAITWSWLGKRRSVGAEILGHETSGRPIAVWGLVGLGAGVLWTVLRSIAYWHPLGFREDLSMQTVAVLPFTPAGVALLFASPVWEELFYRVLLLSYLRERMGAVAALLLQAAVFCAIHGKVPLLVPASAVLETMLLGVFLGVLYTTGRRALPSIVCHGSINFFGTILA